MRYTYKEEIKNVQEQGREEGDEGAANEEKYRNKWKKEEKDSRNMWRIQ